MASQTRTLVWAVWFAASLFYAYQYILRVMPNIMMGDIMGQFGISTATFGQFSGVYYIGYSLIHLPIGLMLDRFGPKKVMTGSILLTVIGLTPLLFAEHWAYPIVGRLLIGIGSSAAILGVFKIIRMTFSEKLFPRMLSLSVTVGLLGAIYGGGPVSYMRELLGYHSVVQILALLGVGLALLTFMIVPNVQKEKKGSVIADIKEVFGNRKVWVSCIFAGLMVGPLEGFADVWGTAFLKQVYGFENTLAASLPSFIFIGMCFGAPLLSLIADRFRSYLLTIICAAVVMTGCFSLLLLFHVSALILSVAFLLIGLFSAYQILAIYKASSYVREEVAGLATAVANMIIMIFGYGFHAVIGTIVNALGGASSSTALSFGIAVIPLTLSFGAAGFLRLWFEERKEAKKLAKF